MKWLISTFYDIRQNEWSSASLMFGLHFLFMMVLYFLKPARDSLFLTTNGPQDLPFVYILLALISLPVTYFLTRAMHLYPLKTVLMWTSGILAGNLVLFRWLLEFNIEWIYLVFYLWVGIFGILVISLYWLLANAVFRPAQSKRLFPFLTLGAILGAISGSQASSLFVSLLGLSTADLLFIGVFLLLSTLVLLYYLAPPDRSASATVFPEYPDQGDDLIRAGKSIFKSSYQFRIATIIGIAMVVTTLTDYQFKTLSLQAYPDRAGLTAFMGWFYGGVSVASLIIQVLLSKSIIKKLGISGTILSRPSGMVIAAVLMAVEPVLASMVLLNGYDSATRYSIDKTGRELLFLPLSQHTKERTKLFIDIFVDRFSRGLGGVLLLGFIYLLNWSVYPITFVVIGLLLIWGYLGFRAKKGYVEKFRASLQNQLISTNSIALNLSEPSILSLIRESLQSSKDVQVLHTLFLLEDSDIDPLADVLQQLLNHNNREIRLWAVKLLQKAEEVDVSDDIEKLLKDEDPEVRLESIYYLCQNSTEDPSDVIFSYLEDEDEMLKSAALGCACKHHEPEHDPVDPRYFEQLFNKEGEDAVIIRAQLADALGYISNRELAYQYLDKMLDDEHPSVAKRAINSAARQKLDRLLPKLLQKFKQEGFAMDLIKALGSYGSDYLVLFKDRFRNEEMDFTIRKHIPRIFATVGTQTSADHLLGMLKIENTELRFHVIKSLNKIYRDHPAVKIDPDPVRAIMKSEIQSYYDMLAVKMNQPDSLPNKLLINAITEKMQQTIERVFRLLGLLYDPRDMHGTYLAIQSMLDEKRSAAIEFLDNILHDVDVPYILPLVDERTESEQFSVGHDLFGIAEMSYDEGLLKLIDGEDRWLKVSALYSVSPHCPGILQQRVQEASRSADPLIRETAELVIKRNAA